MNKKLIFAFIFLVSVGVALFFFLYKPKDPECDAIAKEATKEQFFQKGPYEEVYQDCLRQK